MSDDILSLTAQIVSTCSKNAVSSDQLPSLIRDVHQTLATVGQSPIEPTKAEPAVPIKKSAFADHLVCLECGKHFSTLKRHLMADHRLTPAQYRAKFGLPPEYPLTARPTMPASNLQWLKGFGLAVADVRQCQG